MSLSNPSSADIVLDLSTVDGTATAPADYDTYTGTLTIPAGNTSATFTITINEDNIDEPDETFTLNATVTAGTTNNNNAGGTVTIIDNDDPPTLTVSDETVDEDAGTVSVMLSLSNPSSSDIVLDLSTADGTATDPADYNSIYPVH